MAKRTSGERSTLLGQESITVAVAVLRDPDLQEGGREEDYEAAYRVPFPI